MPPQFSSIQVVADESERSEVRYHMLSIGGRRGGSGAPIGAVEDLQFAGFHAVLPEEFAGRSIVRARFELTFIESDEEDLRSGDDRRTRRPGDFHLPEKVFTRA